MVTKVVFRWTTRTNPGISGDEVVVVEGEVALEGSGEGGVVVEVITIRRVTLRVFCLGETGTASRVESLYFWFGLTGVQTGFPNC